MRPGRRRGPCVRLGLCPNRAMSRPRKPSGTCVTGENATRCDASRLANLVCVRTRAAAAAGDRRGGCEGDARRASRGGVTPASAASREGWRTPAWGVKAGHLFFRMVCAPSDQMEVGLTKRPVERRRRRAAVPCRAGDGRAARLRNRGRRALVHHGFGLWFGGVGLGHPTLPAPPSAGAVARLVRRRPVCRCGLKRAGLLSVG